MSVIKHSDSGSCTWTPHIPSVQRTLLARTARGQESGHVSGGERARARGTAGRCYRETLARTGQRQRRRFGIGSARTPLSVAVAAGLVQKWCERAAPAPAARGTRMRVRPADSDASVQLESSGKTSCIMCMALHRIMHTSWRRHAVPIGELVCASVFPF